jgi:ankyrin repeat protein
MKTYNEYIQMAIDKDACPDGIEYAKRFYNLKDFLKSDNFGNVNWFLRNINNEPENLLLIAHKQNAFILAYEYGYHEVVKLLLQDPRVNPSDNSNSAIRYASDKGYLEIVKLLLQDPRVDPSDDGNQAIRWASYYGHLEVVKLLLKDSRVDPLADSNSAIINSCNRGHHEVVKLLLQDPRVKNTLSKEEIKKYENSKI